MNNNKKATKRALLTSVMALVMCVVMLVGTTFAWFTDTASTAVNKIQAGNLDIELAYKNADTNGNFATANKDTKVFKDGALWEPGHVEYVVLKISNAGNLALKYKLGINIAGETGSTNVYGNGFELSNYIKFAVLEGDKTVVDEGTEFNRETLMNGVTDANSKLIKEGYTAEDYMIAGAAAKIVTLVVWMPTDVGNEANHAKDAAAPTIDLGINVVATQYTHENDSFDNTYDAGAAASELKQGVTISGIAGASSYNTIQEAYEAVKAMLVANSGLVEQPLSEEDFNAFFTDGGRIRK